MSVSAILPALLIAGGAVAQGFAQKSKYDQQSRSLEILRRAQDKGEKEFLGRTLQGYQDTYQPASIERTISDQAGDTSAAINQFVEDSAPKPLVGTTDIGRVAPDYLAGVAENQSQAQDYRGRYADVLGRVLAPGAFYRKANEAGALTDFDRAMIGSRTRGQIGAAEQAYGGARPDPGLSFASDLLSGAGFITGMTPGASTKITKGLSGLFK